MAPRRRRAGPGRGVDLGKLGLVVARALASAQRPEGDESCWICASSAAAAGGPGGLGEAERGVQFVERADAAICGCPWTRAAVEEEVVPSSRCGGDGTGVDCGHRMVGMRVRVKVRGCIIR